MILKNNRRIDGCSDTVPIGTLNPFLGSTAPYGYLICQGQKVSKTTYKELYEICGDIFGQSTDTEFYLPDLRGQTIAGYKEGDSTFGTLGGLIGSLTHLHSTGNHTLTVDEMPIHRHGRYITTREPEGSMGEWNPNYQYLGTNNWYTAEQNTVGDAGGSQPHNHGDTSSNSSLQPTVILNWIVKAFQLMPNQSYVSTIGQDSDINTYSCNYINTLNTYSTAETRTGTWINGKPLYRRLFICGTHPGDGVEINIPVDISNLDYVHKMESAGTYGDIYFIPMPYISADGTQKCQAFFKGGVYNTIGLNSNIKLKNIIVTLYYTKTTD